MTDDEGGKKTFEKYTQVDGGISIKEKNILKKNKIN